MMVSIIGSKERTLDVLFSNPTTEWFLFVRLRPSSNQSHSQKNGSDVSPSGGSKV
jgi:hypothetical protein